MLGKIRRMHLRDKLSLHEIAKRTGLSRNTLRRWLRVPQEVQVPVNPGLTADLVLAALNMALYTRKPEAVIHHSDQGSQYTSIAFGNRCREMGVRPSMGAVGDAYDNAMAESFFATLECDLIARRSWKTKTEARPAVSSWIESWYNPHRRHSALNYLSPNNFERKHHDNTVNPETQIIPELQ